MHIYQSKKTYIRHKSNVNNRYLKSGNVDNGNFKDGSLSSYQAGFTINYLCLLKNDHLFFSQKVSTFIYLSPFSRDFLQFLCVEKQQKIVTKSLCANYTYIYEYTQILNQI